jgi:hypothetical protein
MTAILHESFRRREDRQNSLYEEAFEVALQLRISLESEEVSKAIEKVHKFRASSHDVQGVITESLIELGFTSEKKGLFSQIKVPGIRPDFYKPLGDGGILVEVERGKILANNMDLLDIWKTHICQSANHLFLLVPQIRVTEKGGEQKVFGTVVNRVAAFFDEQTDPIDVDSVHIFGY